MVDHLILKELTRLIGRGTDTSSQISAETWDPCIPMTCPAERDEVEAECLRYRGIELVSNTIGRCETIKRKSRCQG